MEYTGKVSRYFAAKELIARFAAKMNSKKMGAKK
jgi:hypothetical protein